MSTIMHPSAPAVFTAGANSRSSAGDISSRLAGIGAITFAITVVIQNLIRGVSVPGNGAKTADILTHYTDHRPITFVLVGTYVLSGVGMAVFLGGVMRRLLSGARRGWAVTGLVGATGIMSLFALVVAGEEALSVTAQRVQPNLGAVEALWTLHNSVFTILEFSIAIALIGLSRAGIAAGVTPRIYTGLAPAGSALMLIGVLAGPAIATGGAAPLFGLAGLGFLIWLSFLVTTGVRLIRSIDAS
jgi:hypothetical protein